MFQALSTTPDFSTPRGWSKVPKILDPKGTWFKTSN